VSEEPKNETSSDERDPAHAGEPEGDAGAHEASESSDAASPAAVMKRLSALEGEDDGESVARDEEEKLAERRSRERQPKKKKAGLQAAASKRLAKIGTKAQPRRAMNTAADGDALLSGATNFTKWAQKNQSLVATVAALALVVAASALGYLVYEHKREVNASLALTSAVTDERGRIGDPDKDDEDHPHDTSPVFKTTEDRREASLKAFREVESKYRGTGAAILARLSEGSLLLDKEDADGALAAYTEVSTSPLAKVDGEVRGRSLEGMGFAYEIKAQAATGDAAKTFLDDAGKEYRTLENTDVEGFKQLGIYHQARILQKQGDTAQAIDLLKKLHERLHKDGSEQHEFVYLEQVADDALRSLSPTSLPPKAPAFGGAGGRGGKNQIDAAQLQKIYEQMQKSGKLPPGVTMPGAGK
jgi:hypothetical protein